MLLFGVLDIYSAVKYLINYQGVNDRLGQLSVFNIAMLILVISILYSGFLSVLMKKASLYFTYILFVPRLLVMQLTFSFLLSVFNSNVNGKADVFLVVVVFGLEVVRLVVAILVHKKYSTSKSLNKILIFTHNLTKYQPFKY